MSHTTSKILFRVDAKTVRRVFSLLDSFPESYESFNDKVLIELYKNCKNEVICHFLSSIIKDDQSLEGLFFPYNVLGCGP